MTTAPPPARERQAVAFPEYDRVRPLLAGSALPARREIVPAGRSAMSAAIEVTVVRLYTKSQGSHQLRKSAAAELAKLLTDGWQEKDRKAAPDHVVLRLERPRPTRPSLPQTVGPGRPRR